MQTDEIEKLVKKYSKKNADMLAFVTELTEFYASKYGVPNCDIKIVPFDEKTGHKTYPAFFKSSERTIYFREDVPTCGDIGRIIKLTSHEWMHYYAYLFELGEIKKSKSSTKYNKFLSELDDDIHIEFDMLVRNLSRAVTKLSASEFLPDTFAQDILKGLRKSTQNKSLQACYDNQINNHDRQIKEMRKIIKDNPEINIIIEKLKKNKNKR